MLITIITEYELRPFLLIGPTPPLFRSQKSTSARLSITRNPSSLHGTSLSSQSPLSPFEVSPNFADDEDAGKFGFQSWYDLGAGAGRTAKPSRKREEAVSGKPVYDDEEDSVTEISRQAVSFKEESFRLKTCD